MLNIAYRVAARHLRRAFASLALLVLVMLTSPADATPFVTCGVDPCCTMCVVNDCDTGNGHPDLHCSLGASVYIDAPCDEARCRAEAAARFPRHPLTLTRSDGDPASECIAYDNSAEPEVNNGIDDNCDGVLFGDECNGRDDDGDGAPDDDLGSCAERHLFVPFCWNANGLTPEQQHDVLEVAVDRWTDFFESKSVLSDCERRNMYYEAAPMDAIVIADLAQRVDGRADCPIPHTVQTGPGTTFTESMHMTLLRWLRDTGRYDINDWDTVTFVQNPASIGAIGGTAAPGTPLMMLNTGGFTPLFDGEHATWAHEYGHVMGLGEEYEKQAGIPNRLAPEFGCDAGPQHMSNADKWTNLGPCCEGRPVGCLTTGDQSHPDHCANGGDIIGYRCKGNHALALEGWTWGDPAPTVYGDGGRSIMSTAKADGWDTGDPISGIGNSRGWSQPAWDHLTPIIARCDTIFSGLQRRVLVWGGLTEDGQLILIDQEVGLGRMGHPAAASGAFIVEARAQDGSFIGEFGVSPSLVTLPIDGDVILPALPDGDLLPVYARLPVAPSVTDRVTYRVFDDSGTPVSQVTANGSAPVAVVANVNAECSSPTTTAAIVSGTSSFDPDGDSLSYSWTSAVSLASPNAASTAGSFPIGSTFVTLEVRDGTGASDSATAQVVVRDATGPVLIAPTPSVGVCTPAPQLVSVPAPGASDLCGSVASLVGEVIAIRGKTVAPIALAGGMAMLPVGQHTVRWTATDSRGNRSVQQFPFEVRHEVTASCCDATQTLIQGTPWIDIAVPIIPGPYCMLLEGSLDVGVTLFGYNDFIAGGTGLDTIVGSGGSDVIQSGGGGGYIRGGDFGHLRAYGGPEVDILETALSTSSEMYGQGGDDTLVGGLGADMLYPGSGRDTVSGGLGNDTVVIYNACELSFGEVLSGGLGGFDTLVTPLSTLQLALRGVFASGFEQVIINTSQSHLSDCH